MSALFPSETNDEMPTPSDSAASSTAMPSAPDCDTNPTLPLTGFVGANVASRLTSGAVLMMPTQLGPIRRMP